MTMPKRFKYSFPVELCHLNWIQKHMHNLEDSALEKITDFPQYLTQLLEKDARKHRKLYGEGRNGNEDEEYEDTMDGEHYRTPLGKVAHQLDMVSFCTYLRDFTTARDHLEGARKAVANLEKSGTNELKEDQLKGIQYCREVLAWAITAIAKSDGSATEGHAQEIFLLELYSQKFSQKWNIVQGNPQSHAMVLFLEGFLGNGLHAKHTVIRDLYEEATTRDPECHLWYQYAYTKYSLIRRNFRHAGLEPPCKLEIHHCQKAYELRPDYIPVAINFAKFLKDSIWTKGEKWWNEHPEKVQECDQMFKKALKLAAEDVTKDDGDGKFWLGKVKLFYGEFLLFGSRSRTDKGRDSDQAFGKRLLDEATELHPNSTYAIHKVAKLHHLGAYGTGRYKDIAMAEVIFQRALDSKPNYPCLRDYMQLLVSQNRSPEEMIGVINNFLRECTRDEHVAQVLMERGCMEFFYDLLPKEEICKTWIDVLVKYRNNRKHAYAAFMRRYKAGKGATSYVFKPSVIQILNGMMTAQGQGMTKDDKDAACALIEELVRQEEVRTKRRIQNELAAALGRMHVESSAVTQQNGGRGWGSGRGGNASRNSQANFGSLADQDNDWRRNN